jgi:hypothetical protein
VDVSARADNQHVVAVNRRLQYDYTNFGMIFKLGYAIKYPNFTAGISITPPKFKVAGSGFMFTNSTLAGADTNYIPVGDDFYESNYQENLSTKLKSPLSIAIGAGYTLNKITFHFSAEWFNKVDKYTVMEAEPFLSQSTGKNQSLSIVEDLSPVVNGGVAMEYHMNKMFQFYAGFATDFSATPTDPALFTEFEKQIDNSSFRGNIYHFSGGIGLNLKSIDLTVGMAYNYGIDYIGRPVDLPDDEGGPIFDSGETATLKISNWKLLFGFALPISK